MEALSSSVSDALKRRFSLENLNAQPSWPQVRAAQTHPRPFFDAPETAPCVHKRLERLVQPVAGQAGQAGQAAQGIFLRQTRGPASHGGEPGRHERHVATLCEHMGPQVG